MTSACKFDLRPLTFETMLSDPLIRLVMDSDGVTVNELVAVMEVAREAVVARETVAISKAMTLAMQASSKAPPSATI
jgi:hypothetical protein